MCEDLLPVWAKHRFTGMLVPGTQLCTKDGRRMGNAHIVDFWIADVSGKSKAFFLVLTDAGTEVTMTADEILEAFHRPKYISDVTEVLAKFRR